MILLSSKEFKNSRDCVILKKFEIDREQESWFKENGLRLVRLTDKEMKLARKKNKLEELVKERIK